MAGRQLSVCMLTSASLPPREGIGTHVSTLGRYLVGRGVSVTVITRGAREAPKYEDVDGIRVWRPRFLPVYPLHIHVHGIAVQKLVNDIQEQVDVFHLHSPLVPAIETSSCTVVTYHSIALADARKRKVRSCIDLLNLLQSPVSLMSERSVAASADAIIAVSAIAAGQITSYLPGTAGKLFIVPNGIDTQFFAPAEPQESSPQSFLFVGRLDQQKGVEYLISAMALVVKTHPNARLIIIGHGPLRKRMEVLVRRLGLEASVNQLGKSIPEAELLKAYHEATALIIPSVYETGPRVLLEAMACGVPTIATKVGIVPEVVKSGVNGMVVDPGDAPQLAEAICRILECPELRRRMSQAARESVVARFSIESLGASILSLYQDLVQGKAN